HPSEPASVECPAHDEARWGALVHLSSEPKRANGALSARGRARLSRRRTDDGRSRAPRHVDRAPSRVSCLPHRFAWVDRPPPDRRLPKVLDRICYNLAMPHREPEKSEISPYGSWKSPISSDL